MQTYQNTKDSGATYIGAIPIDWKMLRASMLFRENKESNRELASTTPVQFKLGEIIEKNVDVDEKVQEEIRRYTVVCKDDIMVNGLNLNYDFLTQRVAIVKTSGCITPAYISMTPRSKILPMYACYLLKALDGQKVLNGWGTGIRLTLNFSEFKKYYLPVPPIDIQQRIINYLDKETAKIDNLIAKQERLLELLEEKRRALITHSVVLGMDSSANLKETGAHWLGKIPAHWNILKMGYAYRRKSDKNHPNEELLSVYRDYGVIPKSSRDDNHNVESADLSKYQMVQANDLVTNKMKAWQGSIAISTVRGIVSPAYFTFQPIVFGILPQFMHYQLRSDRHVAFYKSISKGIRPGQWDLDIDQFKMMPLALPPLEEQIKVVNHIQANEKKTKEIKKRINEEIALLVERRAGLISNVATGKVKV